MNLTNEQMQTLYLLAQLNTDDGVKAREVLIRLQDDIVDALNLVSKATLAGSLSGPEVAAMVNRLLAGSSTPQESQPQDERPVGHESTQPARPALSQSTEAPSPPQ